MTVPSETDNIVIDIQPMRTYHEILKNQITMKSRLFNILVYVLSIYFVLTLYYIITVKQIDKVIDKTDYIISIINQVNITKINNLP